MSKKTKTVECIKADVPTINGHIYSRETLEEMVKEANDRGYVYVSCDLSDPKLVLSKVIGKASDFALDNDSRIVASVEMFSGFESLLDSCDFSPSGYGDIGEDGKVRGYRLSYFALTPKDRNERR